MLLTSSTTALSHQVANYGMGGQYEPHFDFSRVRPKPPVLLKSPAPAGLRRLELWKHFSLHARHPHLMRANSLVLEKPKSGTTAQHSLAVSLVMKGVFFPPNSGILCPDSKAKDLTRSL